VAADERSISERCWIVNFLETRAAQGCEAGTCQAERRISKVNAVNVRDHDFGEALKVAGRLLLAPFLFLGVLARFCYRAGLFFIFKLPVALKGALCLTLAGIVVASLIGQLMEYNHNPMARLQQKEAYLVTLRQADATHDRGNQEHGYPPVRPEDRLAPAVEAQIAELKAQIAKQQHEGRGEQ
jgi:hypothetical protein